MIKKDTSAYKNTPYQSVCFSTPCDGLGKYTFPMDPDGHVEPSFIYHFCQQECLKNFINLYQLEPYPPVKFTPN